MVMSAEEGRILPPPNYSASEHGKYLFHELLDQLKAYRFNMPPHLTDEDLEFLVRRTLIYVARGCDRMSALSTNPPLSKLRLPLGDFVIYPTARPSIRGLVRRIYYQGYSVWTYLFPNNNNGQNR